jgi:hypothetical protein
MKTKYSIIVATCAATGFAAWELFGHRYMMAVPMPVWHIVSAAVGTVLATVLVIAVTHTILSQYRQIAELARLRDYLVRMEAHYLRLPTSQIPDPQLHFETQALIGQFAAAQRDFTSRSPIVRTKAALEMAEIAIDKETGKGVDTTFFQRACAHLAAGLYLEKDPSVRSEIANVLEEMADFAAETDQALLRHLMSEITHANCTALKVFEAALVTYLCGLDEDTAELYTRLSAVARIREIDMDVGALLRDIGESERVKGILAGLNSTRDTRREFGRRTKEDERKLLENLNAAAGTLVDSRDTLAATLKKLTSPPGFPGAVDGIGLWKPEYVLSLADTFLVDADLDNAHLEGANLQGAWLAGAKLGGAHLQRAALTDARMEESHLNSAGLEYANLDRAALQGAGMSEARLCGANLIRAHLEGAYLIGANLDKALLYKAVVEKTRDGKTIRADFKNANWWEARFTDRISGDTDKGLQSWLAILYPQPLAPRQNEESLVPR